LTLLSGSCAGRRSGLEDYSGAAFTFVRRSVRDYSAPSGPFPGRCQHWIPRRREPQKLPEILSREELLRLFAAATAPRDHALLLTTYAAGLRVSEVTRLQVGDIDSGRMVIRVRQGKGNKDRETVLSKALLTELRTYWKLEKPSPWLFPGEKKDQPMTTKTALGIYTDAKELAGVAKAGGIHSLRHGFAVGLLEHGVPVRTIQMLMGHSSILSTMRYLRLTAHKVGEEHSLLDLIRVPDGTAAAETK
jgi:site-specific recombinase XerD